MTGRLRVGTSGWTYADWRGPFYPPGLPRRLELPYAASKFASLEVNGSFYSLQRPDTYRRWHDLTPDGFEFAVKGPRFITHMKRLRDVEVPLANFYASGVLLLAGKLGPFLWQLPAVVPFEAERLDTFLRLLPRTTTQAATLALNHDERLLGREWTEAVTDAPLRHALEVRHPSFITPEFADLLRAHSVALVVADTPGLFPLIEEITAPFVYVRLHGSQELYRSAYTDDELEYWAARVRAWQTGGTPADARRLTDLTFPPVPRDVHVYFDNDTHAHAPRDALGLAQRLGITWAPPEVPLPPRGRRGQPEITERDA